MKKLFCVALLLFLSLEANAAVVYTQPPGSGGGLLQSSWLDPSESDYDQYVWDNFSLASSQAISEIDWRGGYDPAKFGSGGPVVSFTVSIYASIPAGTEPDVLSPPLVEYNVVGNAGETLAGTFGGTTMYDYTFTLPTPFRALAGTTYWIQIVAHQHAIPDWGISKGTGGDGKHFKRIDYQGDSYWWPGAPDDAAFTLKTAALPQPVPPVAEANGSYAGTTGSPITFDAAGSFDPDGTIVLYEWDWNNDGIYDESTNLQIISHAWILPYTGTVRLRVTDNDGLTAISTALVDVINPGLVAEAGGPYAGVADSPITFDASGSQDPGGTVVSYEWDWNNDGIYDETTSSPTITHTWNTPYSGTVGLKVTGVGGLAAYDTAAVQVAVMGAPVQGSMIKDLIDPRKDSFKINLDGCIGLADAVVNLATRAVHIEVGPFAIDIPGDMFVSSGNGFYQYNLSDKTTKEKIKVGLSPQLGSIDLFGKNVILNGIANPITIRVEIDGWGCENTGDWTKSKSRYSIR